MLNNEYFLLCEFEDFLFTFHRDHNRFLIKTKTMKSSDFIRPEMFARRARSHTARQDVTVQRVEIFTHGFFGEKQSTSVIFFG